MLQNYLKIAWRNLVKHSTVSYILVLGSAASIAAFLLIARYVATELSYDDFHANADDIYRIRLDDYKQGALTNSSVVSYHAEAPAIKAAFPEVEDFVRLHRANGMISYREASGALISYHEAEAFYADSSLFEVFSFPLLKGAASQVLRRPESVVISETAAQRYFGEHNPIGKIIQLSTEWQGGEYVVEGVFADIPVNSHLHFDFVFSIQNLLKNEQFVNGGWYWTNFYTYLLLKKGTPPEVLESKLSAVIEKNIGKDLKKFGVQEAFVLQPLRSIHLRSHTHSEVEATGNAQTVYALILVALLILGIGWLNYINLATAIGVERALEVGVRKVLGSRKGQLFGQFVAESLLLNLAAGLVGVAIYWTALTGFGPWVQSNIGFLMPQGVGFWATTIGTILLGCALSGLYPAFMLSSFKPLAVLKSGMSRRAGGEFLRKSLVVFQFTIAIALIVATLVIDQQIDFMQRQDLGMNLEQKLAVKAPKVLRTDSFTNDIEFFKNQLAAYQDIEGVTASSEVPGQEIFWTDELQRLHQASADFVLCDMLAVDEDFIPVYEIDLLAGRNFVKDLVFDNDAVILNRSALKSFGFTTPESAIDQEIGKMLPQRIIGVVDDFHQQSLKATNRPIVFQHLPWNSTYLTIALNTRNLQKSISNVQDSYQKAFPGNAFESFFLDNHFQQQYTSDRRVATLFNGFALLAIGLACLGLFGLATFTAEARTKEIGVRKVLGASVASIVALLSKDFLKLVLIAIVIASPIAWYAMNEWLADFAYKIDINWWVFALAGGLAVGIALLTVSFQSVKAALANPVESLRSE